MGKLNTGERVHLDRILSRALALLEATDRMLEEAHRIRGALIREIQILLLYTEQIGKDIGGDRHD